jgi:hypothetical protein
MDNDSLLSKIAFIASIAIDLVSLTAFFVFRTFNETPYGTILSESFVKSVKSRYIFQGMVFGSLMLFFISLVATVIMVFVRVREPDQTPAMNVVAACLLIVGMVIFIATSKDSIAVMFVKPEIETVTVADKLYDFNSSPDGLRGVSTYTLCFSNGKSERVSKKLYSETTVGETFYLITCRNIVINEFKATQYKL